MDNPKPLNRIKVMLAERMVTNKELAEMLGKDPATVSKWVTNTSQPSLENLIEIARCLKCEISCFTYRRKVKLFIYAYKQKRPVTLSDT